MLKLSERESEALLKHAGVRDPAAEAREQERKRQVDLNILLSVGAVQDRHALEYWQSKNKERLKQEREAEEDRLDLRAKQRAINRRAPPLKKQTARKVRERRQPAPQPRRGFMEDMPVLGNPFRNNPFDEPDW